MRERLVRAGYRVATTLLLPVVLAYFWWRGRRERAYRQHWRERLGYIDTMPSDAIWIHAASVGEVALAEPLVRALAQRTSQRAIVVTTLTPTGAARVRQRLTDVAVHCYVPLDTHAATRRFMQRLRPHCGVIVETELWPHLLWAAQHAAVPVVMANANISQRSAQRYQQPWLAALMRPAVASLAGVGAAAPVHAGRFEALGAQVGRIRVTGNLKYDMAPDAQLPATAATLRRQWQAEQRFVWVAASTHDGEEEQILAAHRQLRNAGHNALLILAPRHPQRFDDVRDLLQTQAWAFAARSREDTVTADSAVVLGDTLGDVPLFYALADVAFVGGSLVPGIGGHNMLEAAALACPMVVGPHTEEWQDITATLTSAQAMQVVADAEALASCLCAWRDDSAAARAAGGAALACFEAERGALARLLRLLQDVADV